MKYIQCLADSFTGVYSRQGSDLSRNRVVSGEELGSPTPWFRWAFYGQLKHRVRPVTRASNRNERFHFVFLGNGDELYREFLPSRNG